MAQINYTATAAMCITMQLHRLRHTAVYGMTP